MILLIKVDEVRAILYRLVDQSRGHISRFNLQGCLVFLSLKIQGGNQLLDGAFHFFIWFDRIIVLVGEKGLVFVFKVSLSIVATFFADCHTAWQV